MFGDDALDDGETETCAAPARGEIWLEEARQIGACDAVARVSDLDEQETACGVVRGGNGHVPVGLRLLGHRFERVVNQVDEDAAHLLRVEHCGGQRAREMHVKPHAFEPVFVERDGLADDLVQVRRFEARVRQTGEARELVNHRL